MFGDEAPQGSIIERVIQQQEEKYAKESTTIFDQADQGTSDKVSEGPAQGGRDRDRQAGKGPQGNQVSEPLQGDLFNANPKTEKQLDLFSVIPENLGKTGGNKKTVKADQKGKGKTSKGGVQLEQTQRIGVRTTGYIQHRGLVVESDADVAAFLATL